MSINGLVSIITPVYNSSKYLCVTLDSVLSQTYSKWEHILVDDVSEDTSYEILASFAAKDSRFIVLKNEINRGAGHSRNRGIQAARGQYIAFLDSDDIWSPEKLKNHIAFMQKSKAVFSHTSYGYINEHGKKIKGTFHVSRRIVSYKDLLKRTEISCLTAIYDASRIGKYYMSDHRRKQDYALWLSILKDGHVSYGLDEELAWYRQHNQSATSRKSNLLFKHIYFLRETQDLNFFQAIFYTLFWAINGLIRYYIKR